MAFHDEVPNTPATEQADKYVVQSLLAKAAQAETAEEAQAFTHAALNASHALATMSLVRREEENHAIYVKSLNQ